MPDVASRLSAGGQVLDLGCGTGWSSIAIAQAFPAVRVHGLDTDTASVDEARRHAAQAGVAERAAVLHRHQQGGGEDDDGCCSEHVSVPIAALSANRATRMTPESRGAA